MGTQTASNEIAPETQATSHAPSDMALDVVLSDKPCAEQLERYELTRSDEAFISLADCRLDIAHGLIGSGQYRHALAVLDRLQTVHQNHPGKINPRPFAKAGEMLQAFIEAAYGAGDYEQASQYQQRQLKRSRMQARYGINTPLPAPPLASDSTAQTHLALGRVQNAEPAFQPAQGSQ